MHCRVRLLRFRVTLLPGSILCHRIQRLARILYRRIDASLHRPSSWSLHRTHHQLGKSRSVRKGCQQEQRASSARSSTTPDVAWRRLVLLWHVLLRLDGRTALSLGSSNGCSWYDSSRHDLMQKDTESYVSVGFLGAGFNVVFQQCLNFLADTYGPCEWGLS